MELDSLTSLTLKAKSCRWRLRFVKVVDVRQKWLADFLLWFVPKVGLRVVLDSIIYEHATASGCRFGVGVHYTPCEVPDD